jgi:hypothetical protein
MNSDEIKSKFAELNKLLDLDILVIQKRYQLAIDTYIDLVIKQWHKRYPNHEFKIETSGWSGTQLRWKRKNQRLWKYEFDLVRSRRIHNELIKQFEEIISGHARTTNIIEFYDIDADGSM